MGLRCVDARRPRESKGHAEPATDAWESGEVQRGVGHLNNPFSSHGNRTWHKLGECATLSSVKFRRRNLARLRGSKFYACYRFGPTTTEAGTKG